jgi:uncharacterized membrane protein
VGDLVEDVGDLVDEIDDDDDDEPLAAQGAPPSLGLSGRASSLPPPLPAAAMKSAVPPPPSGSGSLPPPPPVRGRPNAPPSAPGSLPPLPPPSSSGGAIVTYLVLFSTPFSLAAALFVWQTPTLAQLALAALLGAAGSAGHFCMTRALASADAGAVMPFDYLRLPVVAAIAYIAFGEVPDLWVWLGGAVIAASGLYSVHREARLQPAVLPAAAAPETRA